MVLVTGMTVGTLFTLFVVPVFYSLIAAQHQPSLTSEEADHEELPFAESKGDDMLGATSPAQLVASGERA
jgi:multidrug efflux pump